MIEFTRGFKVGEKVFATIEEAQAQELLALIETAGLSAIDAIIKNREAVINILSTSASSRPKARIANGRKPRKPKATAQPEPQPTPA